MALKRFSSKRRSAVDSFFMYTHKLPKGDGVLLKLALLALFVSLVWLIIDTSEETNVDVSTEGGTLAEGIVGTPRFVNPALAVTRADKDIVALVYAGIMRLSADGTLTTDVAESVTVSEDGRTYNVQLRDDVYFHDGEQLTADDVVFTIGRIQDPGISSPLRANFEGVAVEQLGPHELNIVIAEPYAPFMENLTVGILPRHIWKDATNEEFPFSQHNSEPIGAGPYTVASIERNTSGIPQSYILEPHARYHSTEPKIETIRLNFYSNEEQLVSAFNSRTVHSVSAIDPTYIDALDIRDGVDAIETTPLPRTFAIFFNQNKSAALRDLAARQALDAAIDRTALIDEVLSGYGEPLYGPIPPGFGVPAATTTPTRASSTPIDAARAILRENGWSINDETGQWEKEIDEETVPLALNIATANNPIFEATAEFLRREWEKLGVTVAIRQFEQSDLTQAIIRPREYESLLFGTVVGRPLDFYSFWHSSQRNDPGLNVSLYANITTDSILSEARTNASSTVRERSFNRFADEVTTEVPAVFLFSPQLIYVHPARVTGVNLTGVAEPHERFSTVPEWYMETESVWPIFNTQD